MLSPAVIAKRLGGTRKEQAALAEVVIEYVDRSVYYVLRGREAGTDQREDLVCDVLTYIYRDNAKILRGWDPERAGFRGYLNMVTTRFVRRRLERQMRRTASVEELRADAPSSDSDADEILAHRASLEELYDYVQEQCSPLDHERFWTLFVEGRPPAEAAELFGVSVEALYTWASRFKRRLHRAFPHLLDGDPSN